MGRCPEGSRGGFVRRYDSSLAAERALLTSGEGAHGMGFLGGRPLPSAAQELLAVDTVWRSGAREGREEGGRRGTGSQHEDCGSVESVCRNHPHAPGPTSGCNQRPKIQHPRSRPVLTAALPPPSAPPPDPPIPTSWFTFAPSRHYPRVSTP